MIVGIGGISRAGKTSLAAYLSKHLGAARCKVLHMDDYIKDEAHWDILIKKPIFYLSKLHRRFDLAHPETIVDFDKLYEDTVNAQRHYEYVIVEGSYICYDARLKNLFDYFIHVHISKETFIQRRLHDYYRENKWYANHLWSRFVQYGIKFDGLNYLQVDANVHIDTKPVLEFLALHETADLPSVKLEF